MGASPGFPDCRFERDYQTRLFWKPLRALVLSVCDRRRLGGDDLCVPGRKTDITDAQWLCQLMEAGLLRGSFVPPKPQRQLRTLTRYRKTQIAERQREANRLHKALEDTGIKLDCVATDILGVSGRSMLDALVHGTTDPEVLAELAKGRLRAKLPALKEALEGRFVAGDDRARPHPAPGLLPGARDRLLAAGLRGRRRDRLPRAQRTEPEGA